MSIAMIQLFTESDLPPSARLVAYMLAWHHNDDSGRCDPSIAMLVHETGLSERGVQLQLRRIESAGHMTILGRTGRTPLYQLHPRTTCTPAPDAPPHHVHPTPAPRAPHPRTTCTPPPHHVHPKGNRKGIEQEENQKALPPVDLELLSSEPIPDRKKKEGRGGPVTEAEVVTFCATLGLPASDAAFMFHKWQSNGWTNGTKRMKCWRSTIQSWKSAGYLPSQKQKPGTFSPTAEPAKKISAAARSLQDARRDAMRQLWPDSAAESDYADLTLRQRDEVTALLASQPVPA